MHACVCACVSSLGEVGVLTSSEPPCMFTSATNEELNKTGEEKPSLSHSLSGEHWLDHSDTLTSSHCTFQYGRNIQLHPVCVSAVAPECVTRHIRCMLTSNNRTRHEEQLVSLGHLGVWSWGLRGIFWLAALTWSPLASSQSSWLHLSYFLVLLPY